jgi:hypothetical protein
MSATSVIGPSRHIAAPCGRGRFRCKADIDLGGSRAPRRRLPALACAYWFPIEVSPHVGAALAAGSCIRNAARHRKAGQLSGQQSASRGRAVVPLQVYVFSIHNMSPHSHWTTCAIRPVFASGLVTNLGCFPHRLQLPVPMRLTDALAAARHEQREHQCCEFHDIPLHGLERL